MPCFFSIGSCGLLEQDVFSSFKSFEGPFVVEAIGEGVVDAVYGWVVDEI
jgi:hypothetical protein